jgi:hypothetical protein
VRVSVGRGVVTLVSRLRGAMNVTWKCYQRCCLVTQALFRAGAACVAGVIVFLIIHFVFAGVLLVTHFFVVVMMLCLIAF